MRKINRLSPMKKIIVPVEGTAYRPELLEFARLLGTRSRVLLTAAFVPELDYAHLRAGEAAGMDIAGLSYGDEEDKLIARNTARVKRFCEENEIDYSIRGERPDFALPAIRKEARFADLLLLSSAHFFGMISDRQPNAFMKQLLHSSECPMMLLPKKPGLPGELIFAYDGSASATFAIRQFVYLFPEFTRLRATLVHLGNKTTSEVPDESFIRELGGRHFKQFRVLRLNRRTDSFYDSWIGLMDNPWLICGAFGRSDWSLFFSDSWATRMIREHRVPLFIAHPGGS